MKMDEKHTYQEIRKYSYILMLIAVLLSLVFFFDSFKEISIGIIVGTLCAVMGFNMIIKFSEKINGDSVNVTGGSYSSYLRRYLLYALVLILCAYVEIPLLAVLAGFLCHKGAIVLYSFIHRKEDE